MNSQEATQSPVLNCLNLAESAISPYTRTIIKYRCHTHVIWFSKSLISTVFEISDFHYDDVIMGAIASQITSLTIVYSTVYSDVDQRKTSKLRVTGLCVGSSPGPVNSPHKGPVTRKRFPFDDVIVCFWELLAPCCRIETIHQHMIGKSRTRPT